MSSRHAWYSEYKEDKQASVTPLFVACDPTTPSKQSLTRCIRDELYRTHSNGASDCTNAQGT